MVASGFKVSAAAVLDVSDGAASGRFYPNLRRFMQAHSQPFDPIQAPADTSDSATRPAHGSGPAPRIRA